MKKGFTLVELLGVIMVLGILALIAFPPIINQIKKIRDKVSDSTLTLIYSAVDNYLDDHKNDYPIREDAVYCVSLDALVSDGALKEPITDAHSNNEIDLNRVIMIDIGAANTKTYQLLGNGESCAYIDPSGAKEPDLVDALIPVEWEESVWVVADTDSSWYSYGDAKWANAVLVTNTSRAYYRQSDPGTEIDETDVLMYYVWIPRYRYRVTNYNKSAQSPTSFDILFEGKRTAKSTATANGEWLTHPAFSFGSLQLNGFWAAKFEVGYDGATSAATAQITTPEPNKAISKPNTYSWRNISISSMHRVAEELTASGNRYGLVNSEVDTHVMNSYEWGAIAYLNNSIYGKNSEVWINPNSYYRTGCASTSALAVTTTSCNTYFTANGMEASTTGDPTGVYDMSGGADEYVMGAMYNSGNATIRVDGSGFAQATIDATAMNNYLVKYLYGTTSTDQTAYNRAILGDATGEVRSWYSDSATFVNSAASWMKRGGSASTTTGAGLFNFSSGTGAGDTTTGFRTVLIKES